MGYICFASKEYVENEPCVMVPTIIRNVKYSYYKKNNKNTPDEHAVFEKETDGWEVVQEKPISLSQLPKFLESNKPETKEGQKFVKIIEVVKRKKPIFNKNRNEEDEKEEYIREENLRDFDFV